jgi:hypothetical protein
MSSLTPILSIPFLLSLGISLILIGFVGVFFYQKITEQNHKISSMVDLISTMAEELNYIRSRVQSGGVVNTLPSGTNAPTQIPLFNSQPVKTDLINVSDDEDESEDEEDDDEDGDEESSDDDEESDDSDSSEDEEEEEEENVRVINISDSLLHSTEEMGYVEEIPSENNDNYDMDDSSEDEDDLDEDEKSSVSSEEESKVEVVKLNEIMEEPQEFEPVLDIDATLLKSIHMTFPTSENIDYKKLSLNKLRQIVSEKNLSSDSSKLKKPELLKLLGVE